MSATAPPAASIDALLEQAVRHHKRGELAQAESCYAQVLERQPEHGHALNLLGVVAAQTGREQLALSLLRRAIAARPGAPEYWDNLALVLEGVGRLDEAAGALQKSLEIDPAYVNGHFHLGNVYLKAGLNESASAQYRQAVTLQPAHVDAWNHLGQALQRLGDTVQADAAYREALLRQPAHAYAHNNLGLLYQELGRFEDAAKEFQQALALDPGLMVAWSNLAHVTRCRSVEDSVARRIEDLLRELPADSDEAMLLNYALGKRYDDCAAYDRAFDCFRKANDRMARASRFQAAAFRAHVDRVIDLYTPRLLQSLAAHANASDRPVFVIGMPRSGTSLVEQIIASHPEAAGAGELDHFNRATGWLDPDPAAIRHRLGPPGAADAQWLASLAQGYLELPELRAFAGKRRVVDKMPYNFLHLGLIAGLFPRARFVHCRRDPMDTCLSIYFLYFEGRHDYTYRLSDIAAYFNEYRRLMDHWQQLLPDRILHLDYEQLVADQERASRELIRFVGLDWDDRCLDFHATQRAVRTRSNVQVREPIYSRAVGRWKNYARHLAELRRELNYGN